MIKIQWTLFLDRDGVINRHPENHYVHHWDEFKFCPGVLGSIPLLNQIFQRIVIVTNQQGVGKGLMTLDDMEDIHWRMVTSIEAFGGQIDYVAFCPDLKTDPSHGRKPRPNMAYEAQQKFDDIVFKKSFMVGDQDTDIQFGRILGMKTVRIHNKAHFDSLEKSFPADYSFNSLSEFTSFIMNQYDQVFHI